METMFVNLTGKPIKVCSRIVFSQDPEPKVIKTILPNGHMVTLAELDIVRMIDDVRVVRKGDVIRELPPAEPDKSYKFYIVPAEASAAVPRERQDVLWAVPAVLDARFNTNQVIYCTCLQGHPIP